MDKEALYNHLEKHSFIFSPGEWLGYGKINFTMSPEVLNVFTKWSINKKSENIIYAKQVVEKQGVPETLVNLFRFTQLVHSKDHSIFTIELENELLGSVIGEGTVNAEEIKWTFRKEEEGLIVLNGFEIYTLQKEGEYHFHAEYSSENGYGTIISGRLWRKT